ncbi:hypothetical protein HYS31_06185 [Candidatus Woesearchaeota archaeon]|nr:hypothetical protein [Candidatus Woesearchaeota archaeon]
MFNTIYYRTDHNIESAIDNKERLTKGNIEEVLEGLIQNVKEGHAILELKLYNG